MTMYCETTRFHSDLLLSTNKLVEIMIVIHLKIGLISCCADRIKQNECWHSLFVVRKCSLRQIMNLKQSFQLAVRKIKKKLFRFS